MLTRRKFLASSAVAGAAVISSPYVARAAARTLRLGSVSSEKSPIGYGATAFAKAVAEASSGSLIVQVFHASSLGKAGDLVKGAQDGSIDLFMLATDTMAGAPKEVMATITPFLFKDLATARKAFDGDLGQYVMDALPAINLIGLGWGENGVRHVTAKKPVRSVADLAGLRIRVPESPIPLASFKALGANPLPLAFADLAVKLKSGDVEAQENPIANIEAAKLEESQTHISLTAHAYSPAIIVISKDIAEELTEAEMAILKQATKAAAKASRDSNDEGDTKGLEVLRSRGWTVVSDVDRSSFLAKSDAINEAVSQVVGAEVLAKLKGLSA